MNRRLPDSEAEPMDYHLARAIQLAFEAESVFGVDQLPRGERLELNPNPDQEEPEPVSVPISDLEPVAKQPTEPVPQSEPVVVDAPVAPAVPEIESPEPVQPLASEAEFAPSAPIPAKTLESVAARVAECTACSLCETRKNVVPGQGNPKARLMFVGEAPGADEDESGEAFVGKAGQLLTKMIGAMGLSRDDVFIANILKCRPPQNRNPKPEEAQACFHFLLDQIDLVQPEMICALGSHAANNLLERSEPIGRMRGRIFPFHGTKLIPTYHPAYLLREPSAKRKAWEDLQLVMSELGLEGSR